MVERPGITAPEIAARHGRSLHTVNKAWRCAPDWPAPVGKRGRALEFDQAAVDAWVRDHLQRPTADLEPDRLYTARELEDAGIGIKAATIRADRTRGRWPAPDRTEGRTHLWYGRTAAQALAARRRGR